ncbi:MAG: Dephospho-CoA kinase, partial [Actinomycetota bacterium]
RERDPLADLFVNVVAPEEVRKSRLISRGMSEADARLRMDAQAQDASRLQDFDVVIENSSDVAALRADAVRLLEMLS